MTYTDQDHDEIAEVIDGQAHSAGTTPTFDPDSPPPTAGETVLMRRLALSTEEAQRAEMERRARIRAAHERTREAHELRFYERFGR